MLAMAHNTNKEKKVFNITFNKLYNKIKRKITVI